MEAFVTGQGLLIVAIVCVTIIVLAMLGWSINLGKGSISVTKGEDDKKTSPHATCRHKVGALNANRKSYEFGYKRGIAPSTALAKQMIEYDLFEEKAKTSLASEFAEILVSKLPTRAGYTKHTEFIMFETFITAMFDSLSNIMRRSFKANHLALKDGTEQNVYIKEKKELFIQKLEKYIDTFWCGTLVTAHEINLMIDKDMPDWERRVDALLNTAFKIARAESEVKEQAEELYCKYIEDTFGEHIKIVDNSTLT